MLAQKLNPYSAETEDLDAVAQATAERYGSASQAVVFVLYEELIRLRALLQHDPSAIVLAARVAGLRSRIQAFYDTSPFPTTRQVPVRYVAAEPLIIEYDREGFIERGYATVADSVRAQTVQLSGPHIDGLEPAKPYMFVIDDECRLLVWRRAFRFNDLVFGRNRATIEGVPVAHPMLVADRLRVMAAGEIVFIGEPRPAAAVANTKSGHFRPPPSSARVVRQVLRQAFGLGQRDVDLFTMPLPPQTVVGWTSA